MKTQTEVTPKIFLTDYASYNNGTQFEFGHWIELTDYSDADELIEYIVNHFEQADEKSPLGYGAKREEWMITDFEGFPRELYSESFSARGIELIYQYLAIEESERFKVAYLLWDGQDFEYAIENYENVYGREWSRTNREKWELFEERYPEAEELSNKNSYVEINYDRFIDEEYIEFEHEGTNYLIERN